MPAKPKIGSLMRRSRMTIYVPSGTREFGSVTNAVNRAARASCELTVLSPKSQKLQESARREKGRTNCCARQLLVGNLRA